MAKASPLLYVIAVVGTSGKSTTTWLTRHLLNAAGYRVGMLSSVGNMYADDSVKHIPEYLRHDGAPYLEYSLDEIRRAGCTHAVIEASVNEARLRDLPGVHLDTGIWTNLQADDMDFVSMGRIGRIEDNFYAKWAVIAGAACTILNVGDEWVQRKADQACLTYSDGAPADWGADEVSEDESGLQFTVHAPDPVWRATLPLLGRHNVSNTLGALAAARRAGVSHASLSANLKTFRGVPGRMQLIAAQPVRVIVDFANTPSRLEQALRSLRATTARELLVVVGSPDDPRAVDFRAAVGRVATQYADCAILTEAGYRATPPEQILAQVIHGAEEAGHKNYQVIPNRLAAIRHALGMARAGATVLVAGKGTETTIERGETRAAWDEANLVLSLSRAGSGDC